MVICVGTICADTFDFWILWDMEIMFIRVDKLNGVDLLKSNTNDQGLYQGPIALIGGYLQLPSVGKFSFKTGLDNRKWSEINLNVTKQKYVRQILLDESFS